MLKALNSLSFYFLFVVFFCGVAYAQKNITIHEAAKNGNVVEVERLLQNGAKPNSIDEQGKTSLFLASENGHVDVMNVLLQNGAKANFGGTDGVLPLSAAASNGHVPAIILLLENGARVGDGMGSAVSEGHVDVVKTLLDKGADPNKELYLYDAVKKGHADVVSTLLSAGANTGADIEEGSLLHVAAKRGHADIVEILLSKGLRADVADNVEVRYYDSEGGYSSSHGGAYTDEQKFGGMFPLHYAAMYGHADIINILIEHGSDPNQGDARGIGPLFYSIKGGRGRGSYHPDAAVALLAAGAGPDWKSEWGKRLFKWATETRNNDIIEAFLEAGAAD